MARCLFARRKFASASAERAESASLSAWSVSRFIATAAAAEAPEVLSLALSCVCKFSKIADWAATSAFASTSCARALPSAERSDSRTDMCCSNRACSPAALALASSNSAFSSPDRRSATASSSRACQHSSRASCASFLAKSAISFSTVVARSAAPLAPSALPCDSAASASASNARLSAKAARRSSEEMAVRNLKFAAASASALAAFV
mmetsp:Transcript_29724/g.69493  ORF Transcript_29724/g.69493 Transcript_29724/m.69493 type:complete len:207 (+) Transcript_29724:989-1609(+)